MQSVKFAKGFRVLFLVSIFSILAAGASFGSTIHWADWTSATAGQPGTAGGTITGPDFTTTVGYSGDVTFAQVNGGTNYWVPATPYISDEVPNAPGGTDIIALSRISSSNTLTFSAPVLDPVLAIVSLGAPWATVRYRFDAPFELLSAGRGYWGGASNTLTVSPAGDNTLVGTEGHGVIRFHGSFTSISWDVLDAEYWHGFTVGLDADQRQTAVPEPGTLLLLGSGLAGLAGFGRGRFRK